MQLPPANEIVMVAGEPPIRAQKGPAPPSRPFLSIILNAHARLNQHEHVSQQDKAQTKTRHFPVVALSASPTFPRTIEKREPTR